MTFDPHQDLCLGFFADAWKAGAFPLAHGARVLELGCAEADWLQYMREARPDLHLTGIDQRGCDRPAADVHVTDDILTTTQLGPHSFDAIVAVSMVEWAGIGHYGDPVDPEGDIKVMERAHGWIKPGGLMYLDVPYDPKNRAFTWRNQLRAYGEKGIRSRIVRHGWQEVWRKHFEGAIPGEDRIHPDGPYVAMVLRAVPQTGLTDAEARLRYER